MSNGGWGRALVTVGVGTAVAAGTFVLAPVVAIPVLGTVGFSSAGVTAGTWAASMQGANVAAGSFFALCQSAGATGAIATTTAAIMGAATGASASLVSWFRSGQ